MTVKGIKQTNLFGGDDDILDETDLQETQLRDGYQRKVTISITAEVPDASQDELNDWIRSEIVGGELRGVMTRFNLEFKNVDWNYNDKHAYEKYNSGKQS